MKTPIFILCLWMAVTSSFAQNQGPEQFKGSWMGGLKVQNMDFRIVFNISIELDSLSTTLDSPDQGVKGIQMQQSSYRSDSIHINSPQMNIAYHGKITQNGELITGHWIQGATSIPLDLNKLKGPAVISRPQEPSGPFPYTSETISFVNRSESVKLEGTLSSPQNRNRLPAVILLSGSGAQNRDAEAAGHKPFLVLADHLCRKGIAVLRYDDRGTGNSEDQYSTSSLNSLAGDASAALDFLKTRPEIDPGRIGFVGFDEGALVACMVSISRKDVSFAGLLGVPVLPIDEILLKEEEKIMSLLGMNQGIIEEDLEMYKKIYQSAINIKDSLELAENIKGIMLETIDKSTLISDATKAGQRSSINGITSRITSTRFRDYIRINPADYLSHVKCPVLAIFGEKDVLVNPEDNSSGLEKTLNAGQRKDVRIHIMENLNHFLQNCETGSPYEYGRIEETFSPEAMLLISDWILEI